MKGDSNFGLITLGGEGQLQDPAGFSTCFVSLVADVGKEEGNVDIRTFKNVPCGGGAKERFSDMNPESRVTLNSHILTLLVYLY